MVATMGCLNTASLTEMRAFANGQARITQALVPGELWPLVLEDALKHIPIKDLLWQGHSLREILDQKISSYTTRNIPDAMKPNLRRTLESAGYTGNKFLQCSDVTSLPSKWAEAPRHPRMPDELGPGALKVINDSIIILPMWVDSPEQHFLRVDTAWSPVEEWDEGSMASMPNDFRYDLSDVQVTKLDGAGLAAFCIRDYSSMKMGGHILWRLQRVQEDHIASLESNLRYAQQGALAISQMRERLGVPG